MKRLFLIVLFACLSIPCVTAKDSLGIGGGRKPVPIELRAYGEYGYNYTVAHYGSAAVLGRFSLTDYFDLQVGLKARTSNIHALDVKGMVYFPLSVGRLLLEPRVAYEASLRTRTHHVNIALSLGYQMDHFRVQLGWTSKMYRPMEGYGENTGTMFITYPFNLYYSIEGYLRKDSDFWNLGIRLASFDDFIVEQYTHPMVVLIGRYSPVDVLDIFAEAYYRASGVAHVANDFYDAGIRVGINYHFNK